MQRNKRVIDSMAVEPDEISQVHVFVDVCEAGNYLEQVCIFCQRIRLIWLG